MSTDFPAWYNAELNSKDDVPTSSQTIAKPNVACCLEPMRYKAIREKYTRHTGWNDENVLFQVGEQMQFEWQKDFIAMKWALDRIVDFLGVAEEHNYFTGTLHIAKDELIKRISECSCPNMKKDEYKTKENCPLKDGCKCLQGVSDK